MEQPFLQIVRGEPTAEEITALIAVLRARTRAGGGADRAAQRPSAWADRSQLVRRPLDRGPGAWRSSALPR